VGSYLAAADVCYGAISRDSPSNPIKVYEGLAAGRPVLTSDVPEMAFVGSERVGILVPVGPAPRPMFEYLRDALTMEWTEDAAERARAIVRERHTWDHLAEGILSV
jgi:glycosyltransferase involved in cell wall biosynthesis